MKHRKFQYQPKPSKIPDPVTRIEFLRDDQSTFAFGDFLDDGRIQIKWTFVAYSGNVSFHGCDIGSTEEDAFAKSSENIEIGLNRAIDEWERSTGRTFYRASALTDDAQS